MIDCQAILKDAIRRCGYVFLFWWAGGAGAQPDWFLNPYDTFAEDQYLVGVGTSTGSDPAQRMLLAEENARAGLIKSIRVSIQSRLVDQMTSNNGYAEEIVDSRVVSSAALEVDGIQIKERFEQRQTAYAVAVLARLEGGQQHRQKIRDLDRQLAERLTHAQAYQKTNKRSQALKAYQSLYLLLSRREEAQAVLVALGGENLPPAAVTRVAIDSALEQLTTHALTSVDDLAAALAFQLTPYVTADQALLVRPFTLGGTELSSSFALLLARTLETRLIQSGIKAVPKTRGFDPKSANYLKEMARQNNAGQVIVGSYVPTGDRLRIFAQVSQLESGRKVGAAEGVIDTLILNKEGHLFRPPNYEKALSDALLFGSDPVIDASLQIEVWTDRGADNVVLEAGEELTLTVRANQPCYVQMLYNLADGQRVLLYNNYHIDASRVNRRVQLPDVFEVAAPFGAEVLQVSASNQPFPVVPVHVQDGYHFLREDLKSYLIKTRGIKKKRVDIQPTRLAETRLTLITMPGP